MRVGDDTGTIEVRCTEVQPPASPRPGDLKLWVRVTGPRFAAESDQVWVAAGSYHLFLGQLRELVDRGLGWAELRAGSVDAFGIHFRPVGRTGAVEVTVRFSVTELGRLWFEVEFVVRLLRDSFWVAVAEFERLASNPAEPGAAPDTAM